MSNNTVEDIINGFSKTYNLDIDSQLSLYLVSTGYLPACHVNCYFRMKEEYSHKDTIKHVLGMIGHTLVDKLGLDVMLLKTATPRPQSKADWINASFEFSVGKTSQENLRHMSPKGDYEYGLASGFPLDAVLAYSNNNSRGQWAEAYTNLYRFIKGNTRQHIEKAYLLWVPEEVDKTNGAIGQSSEDFCRKIMRHVRRNAHKLSKKVEKSFITLYSNDDNLKKVQNAIYSSDLFLVYEEGGVLIQVYLKAYSGCKS